REERSVWIRRRGVLLTSWNLCCGKLGPPITDDVSKLSLLKHNIPSDYEIPVYYIPKEVSGECWVVLNVYPLEQSLRNLADMFGAVSSNRENILVFVTMLKSLRFTFDNQELVRRRLFQCHYKEGSLKNELYFDYIEEILNAAGHEASSFSCKPPPCLNTANGPGGQKGGRDYRWWKRTPLLLVIVPVAACVVLIVWRVSGFKKKKKTLGSVVLTFVTAMPHSKICTISGSYFCCSFFPSASEHINIMQTI
uniref:Kit ligand n=1 Tax=Hippocampus comes TaxID=109280 RepID=A0A3Q2Y2R7_HIPCM